MKMNGRFLSTLFFLVFALTANAQIQQSKQPIQKQAGKTFTSIQKAFNDYWAPYNVHNGYYTENGVRKKAAGWKQFKRWEYYWSMRVDPRTGTFPTKGASDFYLPRKKTTGSLNATGNWSSLGPSSSSGGYAGLGRFNCVAFRPGDNNTYYVGSPSGGLWKTTDNGTNWTVLTDDNAVLGVSDAVVIAGGTPASDIVYIATGDRDGGSMWALGGGQSNDNNSIGVLKSTDGGSTWATTGLTFTASQKITINILLMDPNDNTILYAATSNGIYKTTDAGVNWANISNPGNVIDLKFKPGTSSTLYASTKNYVGTPNIYRSTNSGATWSAVTGFSNSEYRIGLAVTAANSAFVYAIVCRQNGGLKGIYRSSNSGTSFTQVYDGTVANHNLLGWYTDGSGGTSGQGGYDLAIDVSPTNGDELYIGGVITHKSTDGGSSWTAVNCWTSNVSYNKNGAPEVHADQHMLRFRSSDNALFETNDGGIYYTTDGGNSWVEKTNGIEPSQMYRLSVATTSATEVLTGLQDNGSKLYSGGAWSDAQGGDGMECLIDYTTTNTQYATYPNGNLKRTTNHWSNSTSITQDNNGNPINGLNETGYWVTPYVIDPVNHLSLYIGLNNVWKSTDQGSSWTKISTMNSNDRIRSLAVAPSNTQVIYAADPSSIWHTTDGGTSWSDITGTLPTGASSITYISIKDDDPNTAWVSMGQYNPDGVFQTTDGGANWSNISAGLPSIPVMCVIQNTQNNALLELYAATDVGVYVKVGAANWALFSDGLPNVVVNELEIYYNTGTPALSRIRAASSGRGLWESELYSPANQPPIADFSADNTFPESGETVSFTDLSTNVPTSWSWVFTPSSVSFTGGTTATSQNPQVQFNANTEYTVKLTSTNAHGSDVENKVDYISASTLQTYCAASGGGDEYISGVQIGSINNSGTAADGYSDYTSMATGITINQSNDITLTYGVGYSDDDLGIWIDWNQDGDFDDAGENAVCTVGLTNLTETYSFTVPTDALLGSTTMRIRLKYYDADCGSPCGATTYGEVEDYKVHILPGLNNWIGNTTDWFLPTNWSENNVPNNSYNVVIPIAPSGGNFPLVQTGNTANCHDLIIHDGATITVDGTLNVGN
jgi:photosystem II stability/assembly factor-like uncharacterized protein